MAKNNPPRKPLPSEMIEAIAFSTNMVATTVSGIETKPAKCSAPCPDDITCGVTSASRPTARPPSAGRSGGHSRVFASSASHSATPRMMAMPTSAARIPSRRGDREVAPEHVADRTDADAERQRRKRVGDKIAGHRGDADRRQAGRRIAADHQLKSIEGAGQRRAEGAGDRGRGAAADHDALIGAAQMKAAAERGGKPAGKLGIARFQPDRGADAAGPDRLQRHDHAAAKRHPAAMQRIGLDRVDFARRPPAQQQQERHAQQQAAEARNQQRPQRLDPELARQPVARFEVEQQRRAALRRPRSSPPPPGRRWCRSAPPAPPGWFHARERRPAAAAAPQDNARW